MKRVVILFAVVFLVLISCEKKIETPMPLAFDDDSTFFDGSKIKIDKLTDSKIKDLAFLSKVWGFLKYHHPKIATNQVNWDYELFRMIPKVMDAENEQKRDNYLLSKIKSLGVIEKLDISLAQDSSKVTLHPDYNWLNTEVKSEQLKDELTYIMNNRYVDKKFWPVTEENLDNYFEKVYSNVYGSEKSYSNITYTDDGYKLLSLFRFWNVINYYFPYRDIVGRDWNGILDEYIPRFVKIKTEAEYLMLVKELVCEINDTHAQIASNHETILSDKAIYLFPADLRYIEDQVVVFDAHKLDKVKNILKKGDIILGLNGKSIDDILKNDLKTTSGSNIYSKMRDLTKSPYFLSSDSEITNIKFKRNNRIYDERIDLSENIKHGLTFNQLNSYWKTYSDYSHSDTFYKFIDKKITYINLSILPPKQSEEVYSEIYNNTEGLIIDLRFPSESNEFFNCFTRNHYFDKQTSIGFISSPSIIITGAFEYLNIYKLDKGEKNIYSKTVVALVNENTQSAHESNAIILSASPNCTVIGSQTSGADGHVAYVTLPGGVKVCFTGQGIYYSDGSGVQRVGVRLDEVVKPTIKGIIEGRDEQLERA
ncbi:MAG: hypothetical protein JXR48_01375, partial [Candidatus Delongbacteria bacterium]|nr:hypothetical protein [Candidatus Delongbacteria bacterium]